VVLKLQGIKLRKTVKSFHKEIIITATRIIIKKHLCKVVMFAEKKVKVLVAQLCPYGL